jgi:hypothetical protein
MFATLTEGAAALRRGSRHGLRRDNSCFFGKHLCAVVGATSRIKCHPASEEIRRGRGGGIRVTKCLADRKCGRFHIGSRHAIFAAQLHGWGLLWCATTVINYRVSAAAWMPFTVLTGRMPDQKSGIGGNLSAIELASMTVENFRIDGQVTARSGPTGLHPKAATRTCYLATGKLSTGSAILELLC